MRWFRVSFYVLMVLVCAPSLAAPIYYGDFDWRRYGVSQANYVTPIRNQSGLPSCWAFSAVAALESRFLIDNNTPGVDLNLSEQHLVCDSAVAMAGHENLALNYIVSLGITDEATLPYISQNTSPLWPLDRPYTTYKISSVTNYCTGSSTSTTELKGKLEDYGPLSCAIWTEDFFNPGDLDSGGGAPELDFSTPEWFPAENHSGTIGPDDPAGGTTHCVCIVGYKNETSMPEGGYWIVKNSWGTSGDSGYYFLKYGDIEKHNRIHALTGTTYTEVVPSRAPVAVNDSYSVDEDEQLARFMYQGVRINDSDVITPLEALTTLLSANPAYGSVELFANGSFVYTPNPNFHGTDTFQYRLFDGVLYSNIATVNIDVISINDVPVAVDDYYSVNENGTLITYGYNGVLANDYDVDNPTLTAVKQSDPAHGQLTLGAAGWFTYTPTPGYFGMDSFTYKAWDGMDYSNLATVLITVLAGGEASTEMVDVPEPSTVALLATMVLAIVASRRREPSR